MGVGDFSWGLNQWEIEIFLGIQPSRTRISGELGKNYWLLGFTLTYLSVNHIFAWIGIDRDLWLISKDGFLRDLSIKNRDCGGEITIDQYVKNHGIGLGIYRDVTIEKEGFIIEQQLVGTSQQNSGWRPDGFRNRPTISSTKFEPKRDLNHRLVHLLGDFYQLWGSRVPTKMMGFTTHLPMFFVGDGRCLYPSDTRQRRQEPGLSLRSLLSGEVVKARRSIDGPRWGIVG